MLGWVELKGLRCQGRHGVYPEERLRPRVFLVDLAVRTNVAPAAESDNLGDTLDLSALADTLQEVVGGESRALLEFLAVQSAREILRRFPAAQEVHLRLAKPNPPGIDAAEEAVSIELSR